MTALRRLLTSNRWLAATIIAAALLMRVLVPAGYMASPTAAGITIELCSGMSAPASTAAMASMSGMHHGTDKPAGHTQPEMPCAFSALAAPSLAAADPILLMIAIAFIFAAIFRPFQRSPIAAATFLRPPLRGPPAIA